MCYSSRVWKRRIELENVYDHHGCQLEIAEFVAAINAPIAVRIAPLSLPENGRLVITCVGRERLPDGGMEFIM